MKENKVNVELIVPSIGKKFNIFIPTNKTIGEIIVVLNKTINDLTNCFPEDNRLALLNVLDVTIYDSNTVLIDTGIKNGAILALI